MGVQLTSRPQLTQRNQESNAMKTARLGLMYAGASFICMLASVATISLTGVAAAGIPPFILGMTVIAYGTVHTATGQRP